MNKLHRILPFVIVAFVLSASPLTAETVPSKVELRRLHQLTEQKNSLFALAVSSDGKQLLSAGANKEVVLWDTQTWKPLAVNKDGKGKVLELAFSPDGNYACLAGDPKMVRVFELPSLREVKTHTFPFRPTRVSMLGKQPLMVVSGTGKLAYVMGYLDGKRVNAAVGQEKTTYGLCLSPDEASVYTAGETADGKGVIVRSSTQRGRPVKLCEFEGEPSRLVLNASGQLCCAAGNYGYLIDPETGEVIQKWTSPVKEDVLSIAHSPKHDVYVTAQRKGWIHFWRVGSDEPISAVQAVKATIHDIAIVGDDTLVTAAQQSAGSLSIWKMTVGTTLVAKPEPMPKPMTPETKFDPKSSKPFQVIPVEGRLRSLGLSRDGKLIGVGVESGGGWTFDVKTGGKVAELPFGKSKIDELLPAPNDDELYLRSEEELVWARSTRGSVRGKYRTRSGITDQGRSMLAPHGREIAIPSHGGNCVEVVSTSFRGGALLRAPATRDPADRVFTVAVYDKDGKYIAGARRDGAVFLWGGRPTLDVPDNLATHDAIGAVRQERAIIVDLQFSDEGLASLTDAGLLTLFDLQTGKRLYRTLLGGAIQSMAFVPRQQWVVFVRKSAPTKLEIRSYGEGRDKELPLVATIDLNQGLPDKANVSLVSIQFKSDGKTMVLGLSGLDDANKKSFVALYKLEK